MINMLSFEYRLRRRIWEVRHRKNILATMTSISFSLIFMVLVITAFVTDNQQVGLEFFGILVGGVLFTINRGVELARRFTGLLSLHLLMRVLCHRYIEKDTETDEIFMIALEAVVGIGILCSLYTIIFHRYIAHYRDRLRTWKEWPSIRVTGSAS
ncbi:ORF51A [Silurid herpesvirus 1]|nr:ORF51A [Silurid herpesvirus 1]